MPKESLRSLLKRLNAVIDTQVSICLADGPTDLETAYRRVCRNAKDLIRLIKAEYTRRHIRIVIGRKLKHTVKRGIDPSETGEGQFVFEFEGIPQLEKAPETICYVDRPGHIAYLRYALTSVSQREAGRHLLERGIARDQAKYHEQAACDEFLDDLAARYGDLPAVELAKLWLADQKSMAATN